jgi:hypothetical protein
MRQRVTKYCFWEILPIVWTVCSSLSVTPPIPLIPLLFISDESRTHRLLQTTVVCFHSRLTTPSRDLRALDRYLWGTHEGLGVSVEIANARWIPVARKGRCGSHTEQSWKRSGTNTCCFKRASSYIASTGCQVRTTNYCRMYFTLTWVLGLFLCRQLISSLRINSLIKAFF